MADLTLFQRGFDGRDVELPGSTMALEADLQRRVEAGLETMLGVRFLASEYPTGPWHRGRIDTLGLDENNCPVVIEYKRGSDSGLLAQAISYLSWLESAHHQFEGLVREQLGSEAADTVDWRAPWLICIAAGYSHHDLVAVQRLRERIDLVRYRLFDGGLLSLMLLTSTPGQASWARASRERRSQPVLTGAAGQDERSEVEIFPRFPLRHRHRIFRRPLPAVLRPRRPRRSRACPLTRDS